MLRSVKAAYQRFFETSPFDLLLTAAGNGKPQAADCKHPVNGAAANGECMNGSAKPNVRNANATNCNYRSYEDMNGKCV